MKNPLLSLAVLAGLLPQGDPFPVFTGNKPDVFGSYRKPNQRKIRLQRRRLGRFPRR